MSAASRAVPSVWPACAAAFAFIGLTHAMHVVAGAPTTFLVLETGIGLLFVVAGAIAWRRRPTSATGPLLLLCGPLWVLGGYNPAGVPTLWVIGFAFEGYYDIVFAFLALTFPAERISRLGGLVVRAFAGAFLLRSVGRLLLQDPGRTYPEFAAPGELVNPFAMLENRAAFEAVEVVGGGAIAVLADAVAILAARRLVASPSLTRAVIGPVIVGAVVAMLFAAFEASDTAWGTATGAPLLTVPEPMTGFVNWLIPAARATVPVAFLAAARSRRSRPGSSATLRRRSMMRWPRTSRTTSSPHCSRISWPSCALHAPGSWRRAMRSGDASSGHCTTERSSTSRAWRCDSTRRGARSTQIRC
jgi:hypothetical protein